ncbi:hypothetical protein AK812_SmicGene30539 [Symbiodinium microadriaticum]|uniref:Uncharacterized protein n=1 Tax=Symbiodinium microadriaticum TaxID=2951 RepID=A0A1Q9CZ54_SYMMI|nr:hypothetical protein AK812_SmicGene30539 [Symbiodinium microadriaticum]
MWFCRRPAQRRFTTIRGFWREARALAVCATATLGVHIYAPASFRSPSFSGLSPFRLARSCATRRMAEAETSAGKGAPPKLSIFSL